ncbi:MAG TPA: LysR substrate-binding domain-containing protein [Casimicrobiaceae bacterium]|nr:LysR substrate-binding domain-containing protein [Casimicrobiaceae bacterium]
MELRHLRYFVALAEELSFTRAAERMHVTQSTLSHQIRQLEEELGQRLFDRIGKRVVITDEGEALLPNATRALREVDEGLRALKSAPDPLVGTLTIGATHTFNIKLIPECLASFLQTHPAMSVVVRELFATDVVRHVETLELDLGITYDPHRGADLHFEPLYIEEMVLAVAAGHPFAGRKRVRLIELHKQRMILPTRNSSTRRILDEALRSVRAEPVIVAELDSVAATTELVRRTELGAIISRLAVPESKDLRIVALESPTPLRTPGLLTKAGRPASPALRSFIGILRRKVLERRERIKPS